MNTVPVFLTPTGALNVRSGPGTEHNIIGLVRPGHKIGVREGIRGAVGKLGEFGEWIKIQTPRDKVGFAAAWFLELFSDEFFLTPTGSHLRVREKPINGRQIGSVNPGNKLRAEDDLEVILDKLGVKNEWLRIVAPGGVKGWSAAWFLDWFTGKTEPEATGDLVYTGEPWRFGRCLRGIHDRADRHPKQEDYAIAAGKFDAVKVTTGVNMGEINGYQAKFALCRLFESWGGRPLTVDQFLKAVIPDMEKLVNGGMKYFEFHNEPNLTTEGLKAHEFNGSWTDGANFADFFIEGYHKLKSRFPHIQLGFPGLSPGGDTRYQFGHDSGWRMNHGQFLNGAEPALARADFICLHTYYANWDELNSSTIDLVRKYRERWPDKLLFVTEFGNGSKGVSGEEKGKQAKHFYHLCNQIPGVAAAFYYIVSGTGWDHWALRRDDGSSTGMVESMI